MPATLSLTVFTQRNFVTDFLQAKCDFWQKNGRFAFLAPFGGLWVTYDDRLNNNNNDYRFKIGDFTPTGVG